MKTLIALYETEDIARSVESDLIAAGISQSDVRVEGGANESQHEGGIGGFFNWLFGNDDNHRTDADLYAESVRRGDWAVIVDCDDSTMSTQIESILYRYSPIDVESRGQYFRETGFMAYSPDSPLFTKEQIETDRAQYQSQYGTMNTGEEATLDVVEEEIAVGKRQVERGGVRVRSYVTERPVEASVNLREEHVRVERRVVDRPATEADFMTHNESIEVTEMAEVPVVSKTARVVEEVTVGKEATEHTETIRDTVRRKDVEVEHTDGTTTNTSGYNNR